MNSSNISSHISAELLVAVVYLLARVQDTSGQLFTIYPEGVRCYNTDTVYSVSCMVDSSLQSASSQSKVILVGLAVRRNTSGDDVVDTLPTPSVYCVKSYNTSTSLDVYEQKTTEDLEVVTDSSDRQPVCQHYLDGVRSGALSMVTFSLRHTGKERPLSCFYQLQGGDNHYYYGHGKLWTLHDEHVCSHIDVNPTSETGGKAFVDIQLSTGVLVVGVVILAIALILLTCSYCQIQKLRKHNLKSRLDGGKDVKIFVHQAEDDPDNSSPNNSYDEVHGLPYRPSLSPHIINVVQGQGEPNLRVQRGDYSHPNSWLKVNPPSTRSSIQMPRAPLQTVSANVSGGVKVGAHKPHERRKRVRKKLTNSPHRVVSDCISVHSSRRNSDHKLGRTNSLPSQNVKKNTVVDMLSADALWDSVREQGAGSLQGSTYMITTEDMIEFIRANKVRNQTNSSVPSSQPHQPSVTSGTMPSQAIYINSIEDMVQHGPVSMSRSANQGGAGGAELAQYGDGESSGDTVLFADDVKSGEKRDIKPILIRHGRRQSTASDKGNSPRKVSLAPPPSYKYSIGEENQTYGLMTSHPDEVSAADVRSIQPSNSTLLSVDDRWNSDYTLNTQSSITSTDTANMHYQDFLDIIKRHAGDKLANDTRLQNMAKVAVVLGTDDSSRRHSEVGQESRSAAAARSDLALAHEVRSDLSVPSLHAKEPVVITMNKKRSTWSLVRRVVRSDRLRRRARSKGSTSIQQNGVFGVQAKKLSYYGQRSALALGHSGQDTSISDKGPHIHHSKSHREISSSHVAPHSPNPIDITLTDTDAVAAVASASSANNAGTSLQSTSPVASLSNSVKIPPAGEEEKPTDSQGVSEGTRKRKKKTRSLFRKAVERNRLIMNENNLLEVEGTEAIPTPQHNLPPLRVAPKVAKDPPEQKGSS